MRAEKPDKPPAHIRAVRYLLRRLNYHLGSADRSKPREPFDGERLKQAEAALRQMPMPDAGAKAYLEKHIPRLARTLALIPPPRSTGRVLELGCHMQITPLLERLCGYREVLGAYYGAVGGIDRKTMRFPDGEFTCEIDHFDAERDRFPYPDEHFDLVVAGEILEHMTYDPMHLLLESRRVLVEGGFLLATTPNAGSITSVAKTLDGRDNPQMFCINVPFRARTLRSGTSANTQPMNSGKPWSPPDLKSRNCSQRSSTSPRPTGRC